VSEGLVARSSVARAAAGDLSICAVVSAPAAFRKQSSFGIPVRTRSERPTTFSVGAAPVLESAGSRCERPVSRGSGPVRGAAPAVPRGAAVSSDEGTHG
jgi:hypothetical protein